MDRVRLITSEDACGLTCFVAGNLCFPNHLVTASVHALKLSSGWLFCFLPIGLVSSALCLLHAVSSVLFVRNLPIHCHLGLTALMLVALQLAASSAIASSGSVGLFLQSFDSANSISGQCCCMNVSVFGLLPLL